MAIDLQVLGSKLRRYREQLQESFEEVSQATGIAPDRLEAMESGSIRPSGDEILILAEVGQRAALGRAGQRRRQRGWQRPRALQESP